MSGFVTKPLARFTNYLFRTCLCIVFGVIVSWVFLRVISPHTEYHLFQAVVGATAGVLTFDIITLLLNYIESRYNKE